MKQKEILRNDLVLTQDFYETFYDASIDSKTSLAIEEGDGECCSVSLYDDSVDEFAEVISILIHREDAERAAQAILIHSGAAKVVDRKSLKVSKRDLVYYDTEHDCFVFSEYDYDIPARDMKNPYWMAEWFAHMAEKSWITTEHIRALAKAVQEHNKHKNNGG